MSLVLWPYSHLILNDDVVLHGGHTKLNGETGFQVQMPTHTYRYFATDYQLESGSQLGGH